MRRAENHHHVQQMAYVVDAVVAVNDRLIDCNHLDPYSERLFCKVQHRNDFDLNFGFGNFEKKEIIIS